MARQEWKEVAEKIDRALEGTGYILTKLDAKHEDWVLTLSPEGAE